MTPFAFNLTARQLCQAQLIELSGVLIATWPTEVDCETFLERLAEYVERTGKTTIVSEDMAAIHQHMGVCPECKEVAEALLRALDQGPTANAWSPGT